MSSDWPWLDPLAFGRTLWPNIKLFERQQEIVYSVEEVYETDVPAANKVGKDFITAFTCLNLFLRARKCGLTCRIVNTSVKDDHLRVLWGELMRFVRTSAIELDAKKGGPLILNHRDIRWKGCDISYLAGMVADPSSDYTALAGHHADVTLGAGDESSGLADGVKDKFKGWTKRELWIGNPNNSGNFWQRNIEGGEVRDESGKLLRRIIRVSAEDSPNVAFAREQQRRGLEVTDEIVVEGALSWGEYQNRLKLWNVVERTVGLEGQFYKGPGLMLFPSDWLERANELYRTKRGSLGKAVSMGIDTAEGGDKTAFCVGNQRGVIELVSFKTPNTDVICGWAISLMKKHSVEPKNVYFDRGGGGKQHADRLRGLGYDVQTIAFGGQTTLEIKRGLHLIKDRKEVEEERDTYADRRSEMYGELSRKLDPFEQSQSKAATDGYEGVESSEGFAIPGPEFGEVYEELRRQLSPIPKLYDEVGKLKLPPKHKRDAKDTRVTLESLIGHSPDESDALVLMVAGLSKKGSRTKAGAAS